MAKSLNEVILLGYVGNDPEVRQAGGALVASLSLATSVSYKPKGSDKWEEKTQWHKVVGWRFVAETIEKQVHKGSRILVKGSIEYRTWDDREGNKRYSTEINAFMVIVLDAKVKVSGAEAPAGATAKPREGLDEFPEALDAEDDDLPF